MSDDDVGVTKMIGRQRVWTHVKWAEDALQLAMLAGIHQGPMLIWQVLEQLPQAVLKQLDSKYGDWSTFTAAVKNLDTTKLTREKMGTDERKKNKEARDQKILQEVQRVEMVNQTMAADLAVQLQCLTTGQVTITCTTSQGTSPRTALPTLSTSA